MKRRWAFGSALLVGLSVSTAAWAQPAPEAPPAPLPPEPATPSAPDPGAPSPPAASPETPEPPAPTPAPAGDPAPPPAEEKKSKPRGHALPDTPTSKRAGAAPPERGPATPHDGLAPGEKREPQDFDGREDTTTTAEDALWVPRVIFFPAYLVTEYLVRAPLGVLTVAVEQGSVIDEVVSLFTFGPDGNIGVVPTGFLDFGFRPSVGVFAFYNDFLVSGNDLRGNFGYGGDGFYRAALADRIPFVLPGAKERARTFLQLGFDYLERPDLLFWGIGPRTLDAAESQFGMRTIGGRLSVHVEPVRGNFVEAWAGIRSVDTYGGTCDDASYRFDATSPRPFAPRCQQPVIAQGVALGLYPVPPGYGETYMNLDAGLRVVLDSRDERPAPGSGVALDVSAEHGTDLTTPNLGGWLSWGGSVAGFVDLTQTRRVLSLTLSAHFVDPLQDDTQVPFTELVGAPRTDNEPSGELMRGFRPGRLLGRSGAAATLAYDWPIWSFLDGTMQAAVGNTFGEHLEDFDPELMRFSFAGGFRSPNHRDHSFNLLLGFGTETFEQGAATTSVRFLFGGTTGF